MDRGRVIACDTPAALVRDLGMAATVRATIARGALPPHALAALPGVIAALPALVRRRPGLAAALALPWALAAAPRYGLGPRGIARSASELPGRLVLDVAEAAVLARGSVEERTLVL